MSCSRRTTRASRNSTSSASGFPFPFSLSHGPGCRYDEENIGALDEEEGDIAGLQGLEDLDEVLDAHLAKHTNLRGTYMDDKQDMAVTKRTAYQYLARVAAAEKAGITEVEDITLEVWRLCRVQVAPGLHRG